MSIEINYSAVEFREMHQEKGITGFKEKLGGMAQWH